MSYLPRKQCVKTGIEVLIACSLSTGIYCKEVISMGKCKEIGRGGRRIDEFKGRLDYIVRSYLQRGGKRKKKRKESEMQMKMCAVHV